MVLLINGTELNVSNAYEERDTTTNILSLVVDVPYGEAEYGALKAIFKTNTEDIVKVDDLGETKVYEGFVYNPDYPPKDIENNEIYRFTLIGDETVYQNTRNRELEAKVKDKDNQISSLNNSITEKDGTIEVQATTIEEQKAVIAEKEAEIAEKDTVISEQAVDLVNLNEEMLVMAEEYVDLMYELANLKLEIENNTLKDENNTVKSENSTVDNIESEVE